MVCGGIGNLGENYWRSLQWVAGFEVDYTSSALARQYSGRHQIDTNGEGAYEGIIQPLRNLMAERLDVQDYVVSECSGFRVSRIDPSLRRCNGPSLGGMESQDATVLN